LKRGGTRRERERRGSGAQCKEDVGGKIEGGERNTDDEAGREFVQRSSNRGMG